MILVLVLVTSTVVILWCCDGHWLALVVYYGYTSTVIISNGFQGVCAWYSKTDCIEFFHQFKAACLITVLTLAGLVVYVRLYHIYIVPWLAKHRRGRFADSFDSASWWLGKPAIFSYTGEVDVQGQPHGLGRWRDTQGSGESLKGWWQHGVPIGPFVASEQDSGFGFRSVQIGFATCCGQHDKWDASTGADLTVGPLHWGLASCETSISGPFYDHLPEATLVMPPTANESAEWVLRQMVTMVQIDGDETSTLVVRAQRPAGRRRHRGHRGLTLEIAGFEPIGDEKDSGQREGETRVTIEVAPMASRSDATSGPRTVQELTARPEGLLPSLRVLGWRPSSDEALLFLHGWTSGHKNAHHTLAQFLNLSRLPSHVRPFVFAWPCGQSATSFSSVVQFANESRATHTALAAFISSLAEAGVKRLHIFAHSMGNRLLCSALPVLSPHLDYSDRQGADLDGLESVHQDLSGSAAMAPSAAVVEAEPTEGVLAGQTLMTSSGGSSASPKPLRRASQTIHVRREAAGKRIELATCSLLHPEHDLHTFIERDYDLLHSHCRNITIYMDRGDQALAVAEVLNRTPSLGKHPFALVRSARQAADIHAGGVLRRLRGYSEASQLNYRNSVEAMLDLDVVDISWMDTNATGPRHSYFSVNRWLIDDLAEIITSQRRALSRPHRLINRLTSDVKSERERRTNVFVFLAAPAWVGA